MSALCFESLAGNSNRGVTIRNWGGKPLREPRSAATGPPSSWPLLANHHVTVYHRVTGRSSGNVAGLCSGETRAYLADAYSGDSDDFVGCTLAAKVSGRGQALRGLRVNKSACPTCGASQNPAGLKTGANRRREGPRRGRRRRGYPAIAFWWRPECNGNPFPLTELLGRRLVLRFCSSLSFRFCRRGGRCP